jgi:transposase
MVWELVRRWDLGAFLAVIKARGQAPGRASTDPLILIGLWLYAYTQGVGSARELARLCEIHPAYLWILGGVSVNHHTLSDFRVEHEQALDNLLTQMIAALVSQDLVSVQRISVDGTRQRASAGRGSFKTRCKLEKQLEEARQHVQEMKKQPQDPARSLRRQKALERAAREKLQRIDQALEELKKVEEAKAKQKNKPSKHRPATASTTDPEARVMRMSNGGTNPAMNVQFAVDTASRAIVGVDVVNAGSDAHESQPMRKQVEQRAGRKVEEQLIDGGYIGLDSINEAAADGATVYAPVPKARNKTADRFQPKKGDSPAIAQWRQRMGTPEAQTIYKQRASTIEPVNGECKTRRGLTQFVVRGINKVKCVALWSALAYNFVHFAGALVA